MGSRIEGHHHRTGQRASCATCDRYGLGQTIHCFRSFKKAESQNPSATGRFISVTHWGFSGPSALDVSREIARHPARKTLELICDFLPTQSSEQLLTYLGQRKDNDGKQSVGNLLNELFPKRLAEALLKASGIELTTRNAELSKKSLIAIGDQIKASRFPVSGTLGFEKAEVTSGGVDLKEVDSKTMQSKLQPGLFFAGEILDLDGRIGGFNFQSAFSTGWLAGQWASSLMPPSLEV